MERFVCLMFQKNPKLFKNKCKIKIVKPHWDFTQIGGNLNNSNEIELFTDIQFNSNRFFYIFKIQIQFKYIFYLKF